MKSKLPIFLIPLLLWVSAPALAQKGRAGGRSGPGVQRSMPRQYSAPRMQRSAPRVNRSTPSRSFSAPRRTYSAPRANYRSSSGVTRANFPSRPNYRNNRYSSPEQKGPAGQRSYRSNGDRTWSNSGRFPGQDRVNRSRSVTRERTGYQTATRAPGSNRASAKPVLTNPIEPNIPMATNRAYNRTVVQNSRVYRNPAYSARPYYAPVYNYNYYNNSPYFYSDYFARRGFRRFVDCPNVFWSLGFFAVRPYAFYDFARVGYYQPIIYGDESYYRPGPVATEEPQPDAVTAEQSVAANQDASTQGPEYVMLEQLSRYVESRSKEGYFQIKDAAFADKVWKLELAQAPAVFEIKDGLYSVVAGFEGTLGDQTIPSNVNVEFFLARTEQGYEVREAWIASANGIARNKLYQSPVYPEIKTWQPGQLCPFSRQPMVPISTSE